MGNYDVSITLSASADLDNIIDILLEYEIKTAENFMESMRKFKSTVSSMPLLYSKYNKKPKYRKAAIAYGYVAFYKVIEKSKTVEIHRILSTKQNIEGLL